MYMTKYLVMSLLVLSAFAQTVKADASKDLYDDKCAKCHGADGDGNGRGGRSLKHKPTVFKDKAAMEKVTDEELFKSIKQGGEAVKQSKEMEAYPSLTDDQIKGLIAYIKTLAK
jgi:mono/diheme cytochrome c family protein